MKQALWFFESAACRIIGAKWLPRGSSFPTSYYGKGHLDACGYVHFQSRLILPLRPLEELFSEL